MSKRNRMKQENIIGLIEEDCRICAKNDNRWNTKNKLYIYRKKRK
jgi:hypothetical protein